MVRPAAGKPSRGSVPSQAGGAALRGRVPPPPRELNLHKLADARAPELESLHAIVASRTGGDYRFPRGKRRRTNSFDARIARRRRVGEKRRRLGGAAAGVSGGASEKERDVKGEGETGRRPPPRWVRRKREFRANPAAGYVVSADGTRRLRTHLWLTKRFEMVKRWGFFLPLGLLGRGRGSRAILKWFKTGALLHDASYCCPVEINGPKDSVLTVLKSILAPSPLELPEQNSRDVLCGVKYGRALLHHAMEPTEFIAPVTYMWRPSARNNSDNNDASFKCVLNGCEANADSGVDESFCQLWIWIHAAAFGEGFGAIEDVCIRKTSENGSMVQCRSLEGKLSNFEITGLKAVDILKKLLRPLDECTQLRNATGISQTKFCVLEHADDIPPQTVLSVEVHDPRDFPCLSVEPLHEPSETGEPFSESKCTGISILNDEHHHDDAFVSNDSDINKEEPSSTWMKHEESASFISHSKDLWTFQEELECPREEKVLCSEKHRRRLKHFYMDSTGRNQQQFEDNGSITANSCPVMLLKHPNQRWSVIFPLSWARAFWIPLISSGARAIGLRERRWIACESGLPSFPYDFSDSKSYSLSLAVDAAALDQAMQLRPPSMHSWKVPIPPPWNCLAFSLRQLHWIGEDIDVSSTSDLDSWTSAASARTTKKAGLGGSVIRTRDALVQLLRKENSSNSLLFPYNETKSLHFSDLMKGEKLQWIPKTSILSPTETKPVLLRVTLHPFREGTFEEGAIVCAPTLSDIELWKSRAEEHEETLQIPQARLISYFIERGPGEWELQMPVDPLTWKCHRWPIGFVTTGTVHRSSRLVAHALCEANLLAQLRGKQWGEMQGKSRTEIFVLVRNIRSTAYRLALASIVLEHQRDDMDFM